MEGCETHVSLETAELLNKVGFGWNCRGLYIGTGFLDAYFNDVVNGKVIKNRYGETDYEMTDDEWAEIREHGKRNIEDFNEIMKPILEHHEQLIREKTFRKQCREELFKNL